MSHKSKPGDGSVGQGVKGGGVYGRGFAASTVKPMERASVSLSLRRLLRLVRKGRH